MIVEQQDRAALFKGQLFDLSHEPIGQIAALGIQLGEHEFILLIGRAVAVYRVIVGDLHAAPIGDLDTLAVEDPLHPHDKGVVILQGADTAVYADKGVLHRVLGVLAVLQYHQRKAIAGLTQLHIQLAERLSVAAFDLLQ